MSQFLRDELIKNLSLNEDNFKTIFKNLLDIIQETNKNEQNKDKQLSYSFIIRFDNKGFKLYEFEKLIKYFNEANRVERVIFILNDLESSQTNKQSGKSIDLNFDSKNPNNCFLVVQADDNSWVDLNFQKIIDLLEKYKNKNAFVRNKWTPAIVQILGVIAGFTGSLWFAQTISKRLSIENPFAFGFIIAFLIFSNVWIFLYGEILRFGDYLWPNISFKGKKGTHWLIQGLITALFLAILYKLVFYVKALFHSFLK